MSPVKRRIVEAALSAAAAVGVIAFVLYPVCAPNPIERHPKTCISKAKQCVTAQILYSTDHDDRMPPAMAWMDACLPYAVDDSVCACPQARQADPNAYGLAMNVAFLSGCSFDEPDPSGAALVFDSVLLARNACSGFYGLPDPPRHASGNSVGYLDGHAGRVAPAGKEIK